MKATKNIPFTISQFSTADFPLNVNNTTNDSDLLESLKAGESLIRRLIANKQLLSTAEKKDTFKQDVSLNTPQNSQDKDLLGETLRYKIDETEIFNITHSLVTSLRASIIQIQQLRYKSMIQNTTNSEDIQSRINVEKNLQKQEFERIKSQLLMEKNSLLNKVTINEKKIKKYKKRIIEKNLEINRLAKLLNENITDITYHDISSMDNSNSTVSSSLKQTPIPSREESFTIRTTANSANTSNMLRTLGALATHVLKTNGDNEDTSANRTVLLQNSKLEDDNNTEIDISFQNNNYNNNNNMNNDNSDHVVESSHILDNQLSNSTSTPATKLPYNTDIDNKRSILIRTINTPSVQTNNQRKPDLPKLMPLPKMSSFNTVNGSINK